MDVAESHPTSGSLLVALLIATHRGRWRCEDGFKKYPRMLMWDVMRRVGFATPEVGRIARSGGSMRIPWSEPDIARLMRLGDCAAVLLTGILAYYTRFSPFGEYHPQLEFYALVAGVLIAAQVFHLFGLYDQQEHFNFRMSMGQVITPWATVVLLLLAIAFLTQTAQNASRLWVILWFVYGVVGLVVGRALLGRQIDRWQQMGHLTRNVAIVGAGELGHRFVEFVRRVSRNSVRVVGVFDDRRTRIPDQVGGVAVLGTLEDLACFARGGLVDQVVITLPTHAEQRLLGVLTQAPGPAGRRVVMPSGVRAASSALSTRHSGGRSAFTGFASEAILEVGLPCEGARRLRSRVCFC